MKSLEPFSRNSNTSKVVKNLSFLYFIKNCIGNSQHILKVDCLRIKISLPYRNFGASKAAKKVFERANFIVCQGLKLSFRAKKSTRNVCTQIFNKSEVSVRLVIKI